MTDFAGLYDRYFSRVYNYARYRVGDAASADDAVSRVFEKALDRLPSYDPARGAVDAWLFAIARSVVADHFRGARPPGPPLETVELPVREPEFLDALAGEESSRALLAAVGRLDERSRELLALKYGARMTNRAIAEQAGLTESHVGVLLHRAVKTLKALLEKDA